MNELIRAVVEMRRLQKLYFKLRRTGPPQEANSTLLICKEAEREVDRLLTGEAEQKESLPGMGE